MKSNEELIEKVIRELHEYARHAMQLFVAFFTFFVAMNYATMGFLAKDAGSNPNAIKLISQIAQVFIYQNILAIASCVLLAVYFLWLDRRLLDYHAALGEAPSSPVRKSAFPKYPYIGVLLLSVLTFVGMIVVWWRYPKL